MTESNSKVIAPAMQSKTEKFIQKAKKTHGEKYNYINSKYTHSKERIEIICLQHGSFWQLPSNHLKGHGCCECAGVGRRNTKEVIERFRAKHGDRYDYSKVIFKSVDSPVEIGCKAHGYFWQTPYNHTGGANCRLCAIAEHPNLQQKDEELVIAEFIKVHGGRYDYSLVRYKGAFVHVDIICKEHGVFKQTPHSHKGGNGCSDCANENKDTYSRGKYISLCKRYSDGKSSLYLIQMKGNGEVFYKIGITKETIKERFRKVKGYSVKLIHVVRGDAGYIWDLEKRIHSLLKRHRYHPEIIFGGHTECFNKITKPVIGLLKQLEADTQIQLVA